MRHELISLTSPGKWKEALKNLNYAFGHTWENCFAMHLTTGYTTYLYCYEDGKSKIVCPIAERTYNNTIDIVTPYGFSGFTGTEIPPDFETSWKDFAKRQGYVCGYIGLNPLFNNAASFDLKDVHTINDVYVLNLRLPVSELFGKLSTNRKRQLKSYDKFFPFLTTDKVKLTNFFMANYHQFFAIRKASGVYNFTNETLLSIMSLQNVVMTGIERNGEIEAVTVFAYTPYAAEYLFNVSLPGAQQHAVPLLWHMVHILQDLQIPVLNLGGGVKKMDSIAEFKLRFGPEIISLKCLKQVYDQERYSVNCLEANVDPEFRDDFFPPIENRVISRNNIDLFVERITRCVKL